MPSVNRLEILIVDDTTTSRTLISAALDACGIRNWRIAKDGEEALNIMKTKPAPLVISDMAMPKMDGLALLKALREYAPTKSVGFILVTGTNDKSLIERGRKLGLNNFLLKPFDAAKMKACIEAVVGKLQ